MNKYTTSIAGERANLDTPVLLIFFNRPEQFAKVFSVIKKVKPGVLYLYQDGPRNNTDRENIEACRTIASEISWNCVVHTWYRTSNYGCDPSEYIAQKWFFETEEKGIILEDDDVPSESFFYFCQELLIRYKDDSRINMICGQNLTGESLDCEESYFFSTLTSIWGWATWQRVVSKWRDDYSFLDNWYAIGNLLQMKKNRHTDEVLKAARGHAKSGIPHYETILALHMYETGTINIIPKYNLISNIGISHSSTHSTNSLKKLPRGIRRVFNMKTHEINFPLKHPTAIIENVTYQKQALRILGWGHPCVQAYRRIENVFNKMIYRISKLFMDI